MGEQKLKRNLSFISMIALASGASKSAVSCLGDYDLIIHRR